MVYLLGSWLSWHFLEVPAKIIQGWSNFLKFNLEYFSIGVLSRTLFSPWRKQIDSYAHILDFSKNAEIFITNTFSRLIGATIRLIIILIGLFFELVILIFGFLFLLFWVFLPVIILIGLIFSVSFI